VFHAGTKESKDEASNKNVTVTSGGRVLAVTSVGRTLDHATKLAYLGIEQIHFENAHYRTDIAAKAMVGSHAT
jgi:phosphoribosylamine--glycine ligase